MFEEIDVHNAFFPSNRLPSINRNIPFDQSFSKQDLLGTKRCLKCVFYLHRFYHGRVYIFTGANLIGGLKYKSFLKKTPWKHLYFYDSGEVVGKIKVYPQLPYH